MSGGYQDELDDVWLMHVEIREEEADEDMVVRKEEEEEGMGSDGEEEQEEVKVCACAHGRVCMWCAGVRVWFENIQFCLLNGGMVSGGCQDELDDVWLMHLEIREEGEADLEKGEEEEEGMGSEGEEEEQGEKVCACL